MSIDTPSLEHTPRQARDNQFRFVVNVVTEHWLLIVAGTLIGAISFGGVASMLRERALEQYRSYADVAILPSPWEKDLLKDVSGMSLSITPRALVERTSKRALAEEVALALVQRDVAKGEALSRISTKEELKERVDSIESKLSIIALDDVKKVRIEASGCPTPKEAEDIAEFAARVFVEQNRQLSMVEGRETHQFILKELDELRQQLFAAETAEWEYKQKMGFRTYGKVDEEMASMYEELNRLKITKEEIEAKLRELDTQLAANAKQIPESLDQMTDAVVDKLFGELNGLLQEKLTMSAVYQPSYPGIVELEEEITEKQNAILNALDQLDTGVTGGSSVWKQRQDIYRQQVDLRLQLTTNEIRSASLQRMLEEMIPEIPDLANKNIELDQLVQETKSIRERFNKLRDREWRVRTALGQGAGQVERFDPVRRASLMPMPGGNRSIWANVLIGAIAGFICVLCIALMWEASDTSIRSIEDVNEYLGLEAVGTIPEMRFGQPRGSRRRRATYVAAVDEDQVDACIVTQHDPKSPISEAYRALRTNFLFATIKDSPKTLMLTSAVPGEGKTTTAVNMAVTMADRGMRVLIVDTDLRRPNVHRVLRMERGPGLADVLREGLDPKSVIRPTRIENLWIISSGRVPPNPSELIGSERMARLMEQLGAEFDLVICDAPSVLVVTDPVLLATHVDTCLMVVSTSNARRETVIRAKKLLEAADVKVVGVVVNGLETTRRHYYYYYYYYDDGAPVRRKWYHFY